MISKFAVANEHHSFFNKHHKIEFEGLLSEEVLKNLNSAIDSIIPKRITPNDMFMAGHDLWRSNNIIKKVVCSRSLAEIAFELTNTKPLRMGFDQLLAPDTLPTQNTLEEVSSIQGLACGLILCLSGSGEASDEPGDVFPKNAGSGIFFSSELPIAFSLLQKRKNQRFQLIAYLKQTGVYIMQKNDPHLHFLKKFDYQFGDALTPKHHPILYT